MTSDSALGFYALFAPFLLPRESLDSEHVISLELKYLFSDLLGLGLRLPDIHCLQGHPVGLLILAFTGLPLAGSVTVSNS